MKTSQVATARGQGPAGRDDGPVLEDQITIRE